MDELISMMTIFGAYPLKAFQVGSV